MPEPIITPKLFKFLREIKRHNDREWFAENKPRYEQDVRDPAVELVRQLDKPLSRAAPMLRAIPKAHGGSVMRIYKDTRFSKDKTPYKTNVGISLRHQADTDIHAPGAYIHLDPAECFVGVGCWRPPSKTLAAIRAAIDEDPKAWKRARDNKSFNQQFELGRRKAENLATRLLPRSPDDRGPKASRFYRRRTLDPGRNHQRRDRFDRHRPNQASQTADAVPLRRDRSAVLGV